MSSFSIIGEGSIHAVSGAANVAKTTSAYSEKSILPLQSPEDYGNVQDPVLTSDDYGTVTQSETVANEDNRYIFFSTTATPYGLGTISGAVTNVEFKASARWVSPGELIEISGDAGIKFKPDYQGRGTLSALNGSAESFGPKAVVDIEEFHTRLYEVVGIAGEKNTFSYNEKSILPVQSDDDFGLITSSSTSSDDYGTVTQSETVANNDYRYIYFDDVAYPFGTISIGGESVNEVLTAFRHVATGGPEVSGDAGIKFKPDYQGRGTLSALNGSADSLLVDLPIEDDEEDINLFDIQGTKGEKTTFSYNEKAVVPVQTGDDFGSITSTATGTEDFGSIGDSEFTQPYEDRRYIYFNDLAVPYGTIRFGGGVEEIKFESALRYSGSGTANVSGDAGIKFKPDYQGRGTLTAFNGSAEVFGANPPDQTVLFEVTGTKIERKTFSYNEKSIFVFDGYDDHGQVGVGTTSTDDFGSVNDSANYTDNGSIQQPFTQTTYPYGTISILGSAGEKDTETFISNRDLEYSLYGISADVRTLLTSSISSGGSGFGRDGGFNIGNHVQLGISGYDSDNYYSSKVVEFRPIDIRSFNAVTIEYITGNNFNGGTSQSQPVLLQYYLNSASAWVTVAYLPTRNTLSTVTLQLPESLISTSDPVRFRLSQSGFRSFYGPTAGVTELSFSNIQTGTQSNTVRPVTFGGNRVEKSNFREIGSGSLTAFNGSAESFGANPPENITLFDVSGIKVEKGTFREIGSGSAEFSGSATESFTPATEIGSGSAEFSGAVFDTFKPDYQGSGSFSAFGGAAEVSGVNPPDQTVLFEVTGTKVEKSTFREIFSGSAEFSGTAGNVYNPGPYRASGSAEFSGNALDTFRPNYRASGSFSALGGSAESFGANPPENIVLFDVSGTKIEKRTFSEVFSGTVEVSGAKSESSTFREIGSGSAIVSGSAAESFTPQTEIGSGSFSAFGGGAEVSGVNPPDNTVLFEVSGGYNNLKATFAHEGTGTAIFSGEAVTQVQLKPSLTGTGDITVSSNIVLAEYARTIKLIGDGSFSAFGGGAESTGANPPENIALFEISGGYNNLKASFAHEGTGTINVSGDSDNRVIPNYTGSGLVEFSGSAAESFTPETEIGSGSFSAFGGGAESTGVNPPDNIALFKISGGTSDLKSKYAHKGTGTINVSGDSTSKSIPKYIGSGIANISGSAAESFTPQTEIGSGSFSAFGGHVESVGANPPENIALFEVSGGYNNLKASFAHEGTGTINVSGTAVEKYLPNNVGSGTLSAFGGGAESTGSNPPDQTVLFTFGGTKVERFTPGTAVGSGSFSAFGGHVESVGANPPENIALFDVSGEAPNKGIFREIGSGSFSAFGGGAESTGVNPPDQTAQLEFGGGLTSEKGTFREIGSGSLTAFSGSVEVFGANPPENVALFDVSGVKVEKSTFREIGSGNINISGTMNQGVQVYVPVITGSGNIGISATSRERFVSDNRGTTDPIFNETLGVFVGGDPTISGQVNHSFSHTTYIASGNIDIVGISTTRRVEYRAPYVFVTII